MTTIPKSRPYAALTYKCERRLPTADERMNAITYKVNLCNPDGTCLLPPISKKGNCLKSRYISSLAATDKDNLIIGSKSSHSYRATVSFYREDDEYYPSQQRENTCNSDKSLTDEVMTVDTKSRLSSRERAHMRLLSQIGLLEEANNVTIDYNGITPVVNPISTVRPVSEALSANIVGDTSDSIRSARGSERSKNERIKLNGKKNHCIRDGKRDAKHLSSDDFPLIGDCIISNNHNGRLKQTPPSFCLPDSNPTNSTVQSPRYIEVTLQLRDKLMREILKESSYVSPLQQQGVDLSLYPGFTQNTSVDSSSAYATDRIHGIVCNSPIAGITGNTQQGLPHCNILSSRPQTPEGTAEVLRSLAYVKTPSIQRPAEFSVDAPLCSFNDFKCDRESNRVNRFDSSVKDYFQKDVTRTSDATVSIILPHVQSDGDSDCVYIYSDKDYGYFEPTIRSKTDTRDSDVFSLSEEYNDRKKVFQSILNHSPRQIQDDKTVPSNNRGILTSGPHKVLGSVSNKSNKPVIADGSTCYQPEISPTSHSHPVSGSTYLLKPPSSELLIDTNSLKVKYGLEGSSLISVEQQVRQSLYNQTCVGNTNSFVQYSPTRSSIDASGGLPSARGSSISGTVVTPDPHILTQRLFSPPAMVTTIGTIPSETSILVAHEIGTPRAAKDLFIPVPSSPDLDRTLRSRHHTLRTIQNIHSSSLNPTPLSGNIEPVVCNSLSSTIRAKRRMSSGNDTHMSESMCSQNLNLYKLHNSVIFDRTATSVGQSALTAIVPPHHSRGLTAAAANQFRRRRVMDVIIEDRSPRRNSTNVCAATVVGDSSIRRTK